MLNKMLKNIKTHRTFYIQNISHYCIQQKFISTHGKEPKCISSSEEDEPSLKSGSSQNPGPNAILA